MYEGISIDEVMAISPYEIQNPPRLGNNQQEVTIWL